MTRKRRIIKSWLILRLLGIDNRQDGDSVIEKTTRSYFDYNMVVSKRKGATIDDVKLLVVVVVVCWFPFSSVKDAHAKAKEQILFVAA